GLGGAGAGGPGGEPTARALEARKVCEAIDAEYRAALDRAARRAIVVQHNAWQRVADRYGLQIAAVIQPDHAVEPTPSDLRRAADAVRERRLTAVFADAQASPRAAEAVARASGARVLTLDAIGDGDWPGLMRRNLAALVEGLSDGPAARKP
ncbi:MAG: zinc ABC transporter substrate-binding protein, partial [Phycisphaerales bacterium]|nr:zinc ABC transporter substrate-binding protein [Phycisphaerales bacterium]